MSSEPSFFVVGVGASAGGLEALERFFAATPADIDMAFVVVQHLSPDFESRMDELLARQTRLPIHLVTDGMEVQPNAIYLIPPKKEMAIAGGRLLLTDKDEPRSFSLPIDHFFRSLASDLGPRAIAIVLSGAGSDGSRGLREIHEAGGLVIAQSSDSARFQSMPHAAEQTGVVDLVLAPEEIPAALMEYARRPGRIARDEDHGPIQGSALDDVLRLLRAEYGIEFGYYKPSTVLRRLERRISLTQQADLASYARMLATDQEELGALYRDLLIGVTRFFRDPEAFEKLERVVVPQILAKVSPGEEIRVWVAGCATGEEAYSVAMLFHEQLESARRPLNLRVFATDVHRASLDIASAGIYPAEALADMRPDRRSRYFTQDGDQWRVSKELRQVVLFARHNLVTDAPFTRVDLLTCRNLLIYLQSPIQKKVLSLFHFALKTGGALLLGGSETPGELAEEFETLDAHWRLYAKRRDGRVGETRLPLSFGPTRNERPTVVGGRSLPGPHLLHVYDQLLDLVMPPSVLVDESYQLVHAFSGSERLLRLRTGRPSTNVLDLVDTNLKAALVGALQSVSKERRTVRYSAIPLPGPEGTEEYTLSVEPVGDGRAVATHYLIKFERTGLRPALPEAHGHSGAAASLDYVSTLETELRFTKESLQATIEELETANEELQATNEELVASNEELQSTNEELHSVNEELYTVNIEHQRKITQLTELTDDLDHLLHSIDMGVLFLDDQLCIRKYTDQMARVFSLLPQDLGRRLDTFAHPLVHASLHEDVKRVLETQHPFEQEVRSREGRIFYMRVLPYRGISGKRGVVMTLMDIGQLKRSEANVRRLSSVVESSSDAIFATDLDGRILAWNRGAERMFGYPAHEVVGRDSALLVPPDEEYDGSELVRRVVSGLATEPFEIRRLRKSGTPIDLSVMVSPVYDEHDQLVGVSTIARDVTQRKRDELEVRRALKMRDQFMAMLSHELRNPLAALLHACTVLHRAESDEGRVRAVNVVERQCRHMARLLDDVLDVSRLRQDGIELRTRPLDLRHTVEEAVERMRPLADQHGIELTLHLPDGEVPVLGDPDRLQQVEANLLSNAIKYTPRGGRVALTVEVEGQIAIIRVRDDGIGIPQDMLERIFEPFVRAVLDDDAVHLSSSGGMGLGLSLVRSIVRAHGGEVTARSDGPDRGSVIEVQLPLASRRSQRADREGAWTSSANSLLLVEDQEDSRELLTTILEQAGFSVFPASDGKVAVALAAEHGPAIGLVDIGLPEMSGYEVARRIRASPGGGSIYLVALTGYGQQQDRERVIEAGFDQHLVKPIDTDALLEILRTRPPLRSPRPIDPKGGQAPPGTPPAGSR